MDANDETPSPSPDPFLAWMDAVYEAPPGWDTSSLCRRLARALGDLGLMATVGSGWGTPAPGSVNFTSLAARQVDALVRRLEDIARLLPEGAHSPGAGQLRLFAGYHGSGHRHGGRVRT